MRAITNCLVAALLLGLPRAGHAQSSQVHPILVVISTHGLATPRSKWEQKTQVDINGTSCAATRWTDVDIESSGMNYGNHVLSYHISVDVTDLRDGCLEGDVPEIDTKFKLTFDETLNSSAINFNGEVPTDCKTCKPKRARTISGTLARLSEHSYRLSFSGDLSDTVELEPAQ